MSNDLIQSVLQDLRHEKLLLLVESAVAALSYLLAAFVVARRRESSPWAPMIALVPFAALASVAVTGVFILFFFIATLGGDIHRAALTMLTLAAAFLGATFGAWRWAHAESSSGLFGLSPLSS